MLAPLLLPWPRSAPLHFLILESPLLMILVLSTGVDGDDFDMGRRGHRGEAGDAFPHQT